MLKNTAINRAVIRKIGVALGTLNEQVVYVGGAVVSLYINDPSADDIRPTKDIDISLSIASLGELEALREELISKGFTQSPDDNVICRFRYGDVKVDVMSTHAVGWAPANPWFAPGFDHKETVEVENQPIQILPLAYFLASKFTAFNARGAKDPRTSHDFEDIVYILDNRLDLVEKITDSPEDARKYLIWEFGKVLKDGQKQEAILGNLFIEGRDQRFQIIMDKLKLIVGGI